MDDDKYAMKLLKKALLSNKYENEDMLINEYRLLMTAALPQMVRIYDVFQDSTYLYVVQELLPGRDLYSVLKHQTFSEQATRELISQTLQAL
jgi:calcium/calmodulin-dependent protein kinase I